MAARRDWGHYKDPIPCSFSLALVTAPCLSAYSYLLPTWQPEGVWRSVFQAQLFPLPLLGNSAVKRVVKLGTKEALCPFSDTGCPVQFILPTVIHLLCKRVRAAEYKEELLLLPSDQVGNCITLQWNRAWYPGCKAILVRLCGFGNLN